MMTRVNCKFRIKTPPVCKALQYELTLCLGLWKLKITLY